MKGQKMALREYQQSLIDAYHNAWMYEILDPLYEAFQRWKRGDLEHGRETTHLHPELNYKNFIHIDEG